MKTSEEQSASSLVDAPQGKKKVGFCLLIGGAIFMIMGGVSMYLPSLPLLENAFHRTQGELQFTLSIYLLFFALSQLPLGLLSDRYGRKPIFIMALSMFALGSVITLSAENYGLFVVGRAIQGLGAGGLSTLTKTMGRDVYSGDELTQITSYLGVVVVGAPFLSLIIGAHIDQLLGWQGSFLILAGLAVTELILVSLFLPETFPERKRQRVSLRTLQHDIGIALHNKVFLRYAVIFAMINTIDVAYNTVGTFFYQNTLHLSSIEFAWLGVCLAVGLLMGLFICRRIQGGRNDILGCVLFVIVSTMLLFVSFAKIESVPSLLIPMLIFSVGMGILFPYAFSKALSAADHRVGLYSSLMGSFQIGVSFSASWLISLSYDGTLLSFAVIVAVCTVVITFLTLATRLAE